MRYFGDKAAEILSEHIRAGVMEGKRRIHKVHGDPWPRDRVTCLSRFQEVTCIFLFAMYFAEVEVGSQEGREAGEPRLSSHEA